jgi:hypothetical protein
MSKPRTYEARHDGADAFIPDPDDGGDAESARDEMADLLAEMFLEGAVNGDQGPGGDFEGALAEETGGPFLVTDGLQEFGMHDRTPGEAEAEPTAVGALVSLPPYV